MRERMHITQIGSDKLHAADGTPRPPYPTGEMVAQLIQTGAEYLSLVWLCKHTEVKSLKLQEMLSAFVTQAETLANDVFEERPQGTLRTWAQCLEVSRRIVRLLEKTTDTIILEK